MKIQEYQLTSHEQDQTKVHPNTKQQQHSDNRITLVSHNTEEVKYHKLTHIHNDTKNNYTHTQKLKGSLLEGNQINYLP